MMTHAVQGPTTESSVYLIIFSGKNTSLIDKCTYFEIFKYCAILLLHLNAPT